MVLGSYTFLSQTLSNAERDAAPGPMRAFVRNQHCQDGGELCLRIAVLLLTFISEQKAWSAKILLLEGTPPVGRSLLIMFRLNVGDPELPLCVPVSSLLALAAKAFLFFLAQSECSWPCYSGPASTQRLGDLGFNGLASGLFHSPYNGPALKPTLASGPGASAQGLPSCHTRAGPLCSGALREGGFESHCDCPAETVHLSLGAECPELLGCSLEPTKEKF